MRFSIGVFVHGADSSLGRVDKESLSQQALMEILFDGLENTSKRKINVYGSSEEPRDISEWYGLCLNEANEVVEIDFSQVLYEIFRME